MSLGTVAKVWTFQSDSNPSKTYETLQYTDGHTSCNCRGWCQRVAADGSRTCRHTRLVDQDRADSEALSFKDYEGKGFSKVKVVSTAEALAGIMKKTTKVATPAKFAKSKKMVEEDSSDPMDKNLKDLDKDWDKKRKIQWK